MYPGTNRTIRWCILCYNSDIYLDSESESEVQKTEAAAGFKKETGSRQVTVDGAGEGSELTEENFGDQRGIGTSQKSDCDSSATQSADEIQPLIEQADSSQAVRSESSEQTGSGWQQQQQKYMCVQQPQKYMCVSRMGLQQGQVTH